MKQSGMRGGGATAILGVAMLTGRAGAAEAGGLDLPVWSLLPFVATLAAIAVLPLAAEHFWHRNRNKAWVAALFALPVVGYLLALGPSTEGRSTAALLHGLSDYGSFIVLLGALYTVAGGVVLRADLTARPLTNTAFL